MKKKNVVLLGLAIWAVAYLFLANTNFMPPGFTGAPSEGLCTDCHSASGANTALIELSGLPQQVYPGVSYPLSIHLELANPISAALAGGMSLTAVDANGQNAGFISESEPFLYTQFWSANGRQYLNHETAEFANGGDVTWDFIWTTPSSIPSGGEVDIYLAACLGNLNQSTQGDYCSNSSYTVEVIPFPVPELVVTLIQGVSCAGGSDGIVLAEVINGNSSYSYSWSTGTSGPSLTGASAGTYTVVAVDLQGNSLVQEIEIVDPPSLQGEITLLSQPACQGEASGALLVNVSGGTPPYTYLWSNGGSGNTLVNLLADSYQVDITDANGCSITRLANLQNSDDDAPILSEEIQLTLMPESEDLSNETLLLEVQQVIPFVTDACSFSINGLIPNAFNCADLGEQSFEFTAIDANGNEAFLDGKVTIVDTLSPILSCPSDTTIAICSNPLIYSIQAEDWCSVELELTEGLPSGSTFPQGTTLVTYEAEDESGNISSCSFEVEVISGPEIVIETINSSCYQANDGYINVSVNSSTAYVLNWTGGLSGLENFDLSPGVYTLEVLDENGCSSTQTITLEEWPEIQIVVDSIFEDNGDNSGGIQISVLSDPTNYVYAWSDVEGNLLSTQADSLMGLSSGMYSLLVTDTLSMCDQTVSFTIQQGVTGLEEIEENAIGIYPNPTSDYLILSGIKNQSFPVQWSVFDRSGQVQLSGLYRGLPLDVHTLPPGVYYLSIKVSSSLNTYSFVIMR